MLPPADEVPESASAPIRAVSLPLPLSRPVVTWLFLAANVVVFVVMTLAGGSESISVLVRFGAKVNIKIASGEYWRFFTPLFIHIGIMHLAFNSYALYALGMEVERLFGRASFTALYLLAGFGGVVASFALNDSLSAGASGAIFGLVGALGYFFARYRNLLGRAGRRQLVNIALVAAYNLVFGFLYPGVDNHGHLGGLVSGIALAWALCPDYTIVRGLDGAPLRVADTRSPRRRMLLTVAVALVLVAGAAVAVRAQSDSYTVHMELGYQRTDAGDMAGAQAEFAQAVQARPDEPGAHFMLGYIRFEQRDFAGAAVHFEQAVILDGEWGDARWNLALAYIRLGRYQDATEHLQVYLELAGSDAERREVERLLGELAQSL